MIHIKIFTDFDWKIELYNLHEEIKSIKLVHEENKSLLESNYLIQKMLSVIKINLSLQD